MPATLHEIINFSLVILQLELLPSDDQVRRFGDVVNADVRPGGGVSIDAATGRTQQARTLHLDRDRINFNLSPSRSSITREFPSVSNLDADAERFAQILDTTFAPLEGLDHARFDFGYNAEMVFNQDHSPTALEFLGQQLLRTDRLALPNRHFLGGACRLIIADHLGQWTYNLEPRLNDLQSPRVFTNVNLHNAQRPLPRTAQIKETILHTVSSVEELMNHLTR